MRECIVYMIMHSARLHIVGRESERGFLYHNDMLCTNRELVWSFLRAHSFHVLLFTDPSSQTASLRLVFAASTGSDARSCLIHVLDLPLRNCHS